MSQFEEEAEAAPAQEDLDPTVTEAPRYATTNRDAVARRRRIEEVIESKRAAVYGGDYDFDIDG